MHTQPFRTALLFAALLVLCSILACSTALAGKAPPASVSSFVWGIVAGLVVLLLGVCGFFGKRYIQQRDKREDRLMERLDDLDNRLDSLEQGQARIEERIAALPCRADGRSNGTPPPGPICSTRDRDPV